MSDEEETEPNEIEHEELEEKEVLPPGPQIDDELEVTVEKLVTGGDGLARAERLPLFIARAAPGDRLRVRIWQRKRDYARAEIVEILEPGPARREAPCPHFADCGGCDLQHLEDAAQLEAKVAATRETLERIGRVEWPERVEVVSGDPWAYRLRARLRLDETEGGNRIGYLARSSHDLVPISRCPILVPELEALLPGLAAAAGSPPPGKLEIAAGDSGAVTVSPPVEGAGRGAVSVRVGEFEYAYDARCFFQAHRQLLPRMVELAVGDWRGETALDLYSGVGFFTLPLTTRYERVVAVESDRGALRYQRKNARQHRIRNLQTIGQVVESWLPQMPDQVDRVLVDPPRIGLHVRLRERLAANPPGRLTYVSCQPGTLARDLIWLLRGMRIESLTLVDLFPQTAHMEAVVQLVPA